MRRLLEAAAAAVVLLGVALALFAPGTAGQPSGARGRDVSRGRTLFLQHCSSCHGMDAGGIDGTAPSLIGVGAGAADFYLSTGRMPLPAPGVQPVRGKPAFNPSDLHALVAYIGSLGGPPVPVVSTAGASISRGRMLYADSCAGCHSITGAGGIITGATVPALQQATARQVAEAVRIGPYLMPRFGPGELSDADVAAIARYVQSTHRPDDRGGWAIGHLGPIPEGMVAWFLGLGTLLGLARLIGERAE